MAIKFCPKCGSMMIPEKTEEGMGWKCRKCEHIEEVSNKKEIVIKEKIKEIIEIPVFDVDKTKDEISTVEVDCKKCGGKRAIWWIQQTRSGDEPATRFYKCIKCGHTWREYS